MADLYVAAGIELTKALEQNAKLAADPNLSPSMNRTYAQAANQLAEALAWLRNPGQSHGGAGTSS